MIETGLTMDWHRIGDGSLLVEDWCLTGVDRPRGGRVKSSSVETSSLSPIVHLFPVPLREWPPIGEALA